MSAAPKHPKERERIAAIKALDILDTPPEADFDDVVKLCANLCEAPICLVTIVEEERQWFKSKVGVEVDQTPREVAFCAYCILQDGILEIEDTHLDERVADNPSVTGEPFIRYYAGAPIRTSEGYPIGSLCIVDTQPRKLNSDQRKTLQVLAAQVSKQIQLRESNTRLREANRESEARGKSLQQMIGLIAHDLRNPIGGLVSLLGILSQQFNVMDKEEVKSFIKEMNTSGNQVFTLLENLLEWSSSEAGIIEKRPEVVDLVHMISQALESVAPLVRSKDLNITEDVSPELLAHADKRMIGSVLRNLLTNAVKFSKQGGRIEISTEAVKNRVRIEVRDHGVGMEAKQIEAVRNKKSSLSTPGTSGENGSGIGMNLIHNFLGQHDSALSIESSPDSGTVASFELDLKRESE